MTKYLQDPTILIPVGILLIGGVLLIWAIGKLFTKKPAEDAFLPAEEGAPQTADNEMLNIKPVETPDLPRSIFESVEPVRETTRPPVAGSPSKEMVDRLDTMSQRLVDMQTVLQKQASAPSGTPLTPETIDKLLKIIGNVTQQVDILQRSLGAAPPAAASSTATAGQAPKPAPPFAQPPKFASAPPSATSPPAAQAPKPGTTPSGKIGVVGGALSSFPKEAPASEKPPANPPEK